ncbi:membrane-spanning 4-domains subfamily A member 13 [Talpa occidentalis]|uniref:membrane-spanning 4-domains subfamily A member 13 n=1 Tax=Talpa occidentalis TaxID=50954 RepID=UPI00188DE9B4|nr:membrane-spanning 4-domains subfamily A member 13 [Talpa occidentalis]
MACVSRRLSEADGLVLGAIQIMIGSFYVLMWYFLLILYMAQIEGVFGIYEPITFKTASFLWGLTFIISGVLVIVAARHPSLQLITYALIMNILSIVVAVASGILVIIELSDFNSVSYRNFEQAKFGRGVSRMLMMFYPLEFCIALTYSIFSCFSLWDFCEDKTASLASEEEAETHF